MSTIEQAIREIAGNALDRDAVAEIVKDTAVTPAMLEDFRAEITQSSNGSVDENRVREIFSEALTKAIGAIPPKKIKIDISGAKSSVEGEYFHKSFEDCLTVVACDEPLLMPGPAGGGKSTLAWQIAKAINPDRDLCIIGPTTGKHDFMGYNDANGNFVGTSAQHAFQYGHVLLVEEMDAHDPRGLVAFNLLMSESVVTFGNGQRVEKHPDFRVIATANTFGRGADRQYVGRYQLDAATLDRFVNVIVDYDEELERLICGHDKWCDFVQSVRHAVFDLKLREIVSPRASIKGAKLLNAGMNHKRVADSVIWRGMENSTVTKIKNHIKGV